MTSLTVSPLSSSSYTKVSAFFKSQVWSHNSKAPDLQSLPILHPSCSSPNSLSPHFLLVQGNHPTLIWVCSNPLRPSSNVVTFIRLSQISIVKLNFPQHSLVPLLKHITTKLVLTVIFANLLLIGCEPQGSKNPTFSYFSQRPSTPPFI